MSAYLYRHIGPDGALLYVGATADLANRTKTHMWKAPWFVDGVTVESVVMPTMVDAERAESVAIRTEFPRWNIKGRSPKHPDGPANTWGDVAEIHPDTCRETPVFSIRTENTREEAEALAEAIGRNLPIGYLANAMSPIS